MIGDTKTNLRTGSGSTDFYTNINIVVATSLSYYLARVEYFYVIYDPSIHSALSARTSINMFGRELVIFMPYMTLQAHSARTSIKMFGPQLVIPVTYLTLKSIQPIQPVPQSTCLVVNL